MFNNDYFCLKLTQVAARNSVASPAGVVFAGRLIPPPLP